MLFYKKINTIVYIVSKFLLYLYRIKDKIMKHFYKGDVVVKNDDAFGRWAVTPGQRFFVVSSVYNVDEWILLYRPFKNVIKHILWTIFISE